MMSKVNLCRFASELVFAVGYIRRKDYELYEKYIDNSYVYVPH